MASTRAGRASADPLALAGNGDVVLLHRLQQRRLGARRGAVDLVGHQELGEDGALDEAEGAAAGLVWSITSESRGYQTASRSGIELDAVGAKGRALRRAW